MVKNSIKFITPFLLLCNFSIGYSSDLKFDKILSDREIHDNNPVELINALLPQLKTAEYTMQNIINTIFNVQSMYQIINSDNINFLRNINTTLDNDCLKEYFISHGGLNSTTFNNIMNNARNFQYNKLKNPSLNEQKFYLSYKPMLNVLCNKTINDIIYTLKLHYAFFLEAYTGDNISQLKLEILKKINNYLNSYYKPDCAFSNGIPDKYAIKEEILDKYKADLLKIFFNIAKKIPLHEMLNVEENFFDNCYTKITKTQGDEQLENIYQFCEMIISSQHQIFHYCNDNKILQKIINILNLSVVQKYFSNNYFFFAQNKKFIEKIHRERNESVNKNDFKTYQVFISTKAKQWVDTCYKYLEDLKKLHNSPRFIKAPSTMLKYQIIEKTLSKYLSMLQKNCADVDSTALQVQFNKICEE